MAQLAHSLRGKVMYKPILIASIVLVALAIYLAATLSVRHEKVGGNLVQAWFVQLPGWSSTYYPEDTVNLQNWVGTRSSATIVLTADGKEDPEATAGKTLQSKGLYSDYSLVRQKGHWVLYRPARTEKYLSLSAFYRVSPWSPSSLK